MDDPRRSEVQTPQPHGETPEPAEPEPIGNDAGWLLAQDDEDSGFVRAYN